MTTPVPAAPAPALDAGSDPDAVLAALVARMEAPVRGLSADAARLTAAVLISAAGAALVLHPAGTSGTVSTAVAGVFLAVQLLGFLGISAARRRGAPAWITAAAAVAGRDEQAMPAQAAAAARRHLAAITAERGCPAWLHVRPCPGTCTALCRSAVTVPLPAAVLIIAGDQVAADPAVLDGCLAHEAGHATGRIRPVLDVVHVTAGGWGRPAAALAGALAGGLPGALAAAAACHVTAVAATWAAEVACDRRAARTAGPAALAAALDFMAATRPPARTRSRAARTRRAALHWAAGPAHPPLALRRALAPRPRAVACGLG
jgi:hypothetical protein